MVVVSGIHITWPPNHRGLSDAALPTQVWGERWAGRGRSTGGGTMHDALKVGDWWLGNRLVAVGGLHECQVRRLYVGRGFSATTNRMRSSKTHTRVC
jgi:hypothetical protein